jgi:acetyl-CoA acyltransferase
VCSSDLDEITPITTKAGVVDTDGTIRANSTPEDLAKLNPVFDVYGTVTAGTSSPLTDGAAAVIVTSEDYAKKHKLPILARIKAMAISGLDPAVMGLGPISASQKALARAGLKISDMDVIELNEAFAAQSIPCMAELGCDAKKVNVEGGAIALGHPLGASGARITGKAALLLSRGKGKYALATACIGGGQGIATILERA